MSVRKANSNLTPRSSIVCPKPLNFTSKKQAVTFSYNYVVSPLRSYNSGRSYKSTESNYEDIAVLKRLATSLTEVVTVVITRVRGASWEASQISGDLEIWGPGNLGIWNPKKSKKQKLSKSKSVLPNMSARFLLAGTKKTSRPHLGPSRAIFCVGRKNPKLHKFCLFSLVGPWALFTRFGALAAIHPRWGNRYVSCSMHLPR